MCRAAKLFDCSRVLKSCFNAYVLFTLEYCASIGMPIAESYFGLVNSVARSAARLCEGKLYYLRHRSKISASRLRYKIYHRVDYPMLEYLHHFVAARNSSTATLGELTLVIPWCRTDKFKFS